MKAQTIHANACGDVLNVTSAAGFRVEDANGRVVELRVESGEAVLHIYGMRITAKNLGPMLYLLNQEC